MLSQRVSIGLIGLTNDKKGLNKDEYFLEPYLHQFMSIGIRSKSIKCNT